MMWIAAAIDRLAMTKLFLSSPSPSPVIANEVKQSTLCHVDTCMIWIAAAINRLAMTRLYFVGDNGVPLCQKQNRLAMTKPPEKGALLLRSQ